MCGLILVPFVILFRLLLGVAFFPIVAALILLPILIILGGLK